MPPFSRLELTNFKSYRDQVRVEWRQLSSIVGLNGAGKSTILDAIEYVFCFPKYNTNRKAVALLRKDVCNIQFAESEDCPSTVVKATLIHDEQEVTFERSTDYYENVHRFVVNDEELTSKEYKKRLLGFNINSSANNFLVKQNSIERIAIMNAKERCEFFERACNSIVYKNEYNSLKSDLKVALEEVENSKKRLNFYSKKLKDLGKLSKAVEKYEKLQTELANVDFEYYFASLFAIDEDLDRTRKEKEAQNVKIRVAEKIKTSYENKIAELKSSLEDEERESKLDKLQQKLSKYLLKGDKLQDLLTAQKNSIKKMKTNLETAKKHDAARAKTIEDLQQQLDEVQKQKEDEERLESLSGSIQLDDKQYEEYLRLKSETIMYTVKESELRDSIQRQRDLINDKIEDYQRHEKSLLNQIEKENSHVKKLESDIAQTKEHCESTQSDIEKCSREIYDLEIDLHNSNSQVEALNRDISDLNMKIGDSKLSAEWDRITKRKNLIIHKLKSRFTGVYDRLHNLIEITDSRYNVAVTKILGNKKDYILVDNNDTAQKCIYFIKEQFAGKTFNVVETFMPLDSIKIPDPQYVLAKINDDPMVALGTSVVYASQVLPDGGLEKIENALHNVMKNIVICENEEIAMEYCRKKRIDTVSLSGTLYKTDGVFSGGKATLLEKSRVWSEKDIENLKKQKEDKLEEMKGLVFEINKKKEKKNEIDIKLSGLQSRLKNYLQPLLADQERTLNADKDKLTKLNQQLSDFKDSSNIEELMIELKKLDDKLVEIKKKIEAIENEHFASFCQKLNIDTVQQYEKGDFKKYKQRCERKKQIEDHYCKIKNQLTLEMNRFTQFNVNKLEEDIKNLEEVNLQTKDSQVKLNEKINETKQLITSLKQELMGEQTKKELKIKERELIAVNNELREWKSYISSNDAKIIRLEAKKHDIFRKCLEKNVDIPLHDTTIEKVVLSTKTAVNTESENTTESESDSQVNEKNVEIDYSKLPKSIKKLEKGKLSFYIKTLEEKQMKINEQIKSVDINPKSKEEYESMKNLLKELSQQNEKLLIDATEIKGKFDEVKNQRTETFNKFFNSIANSIDRILKNLYGSEGAQAYIYAKSEEEPYLDGIDYQCIIPKKKFGMLKNFSGGEKTMSAIALLLATYNAKPAPFLIFDEIDVALDNKNISRMVKYFIQLKPTTQIINISHHYQLAEFADAMIGVSYSPQKRTSYVVHIDLDDYQRNIQPDKCLVIAAEERLAALT